MQQKIEIFENTLLKLLVRRGADSERKSIVLSEGELGYTTDTKRLFVGDGVASGGAVVGNVFLGRNTNLTTFAGAGTTGDSAFDIDNATYSVLLSGTGSSVNDWLPVGGVYTAGDNTITINSANQISVSQLSAGNVSQNALGNSLVISSSQVALSTTISVDRIVTRQTDSTSALSLPRKLTIGGVPYTFPDSILPEGYLYTDRDGVLSFSRGNNYSTLVSVTTAGLVPVGSLQPILSATILTSDWLSCSGQAVSRTTYSSLFAAISTSFGVGDGSTTFNIPNQSTYPLSASGTKWLIKAIPEVVSPAVTISTSATISASLNGAQVSTFASLTGGTAILGVNVNAVRSELLQSLYPVGEVYLTSQSTGVSSFMGFGTWTRSKSVAVGPSPNLTYYIWTRLT